MIELTEIRSFGEGKSNVRLWSRLGFCRKKERSVRESFANVIRILACSCGPQRGKTRVVKEVELISESVELGGERFSGWVISVVVGQV